MFLLRFAAFALLTVCPFAMGAVGYKEPAQWFFVQMKKGPANQDCTALPVGTTPAQSLARFVPEPVEKVTDDVLREYRLQVFEAKSRGRYIFTSNEAGCHHFRTTVHAIAEQKDVADKGGWLVADGAGDVCRPLVALFSSMKRRRGPVTPSEAEVDASEAGMSPKLEFATSTAASFSLTYAGGDRRNVTLFAKKADCRAYLDGLREVKKAMQNPSRPVPAVAAGSRFGS